MWRRRRRKKGKFFVGCFILLLIGVVYGYITNDIPIPDYIRNKDKKEIKIGEIIVNPPSDMDTKTPQNAQQEGNISDVEPIINDDNIVTDHTQIVFNTYYNKTREMLTQKSKLPSELVGRSFDELKTYLKENYGEWNIRECNKHKVELYQVTDRIPPNYYIVKEYNGYIAIFQVNEEGKSILIEQTEIPISSLSDMDLQYIKQGIIKRERNEINQILEDYSS